MSQHVTTIVSKHINVSEETKTVPTIDEEGSIESTANHLTFAAFSELFEVVIKNQYVNA